MSTASTAGKLAAGCLQRAPQHGRAAPCSPRPALNLSLPRHKMSAIVPTSKPAKREPAYDNEVP